LNKACNISACQAILSNLKDFEQLRKEARHLAAEAALSQTLPPNMEELCGIETYEFSQSGLNQLNKKFNQSSVIKEVLHLVIRLVKPQIGKLKYDLKDHQRYYLKNEVKET
jgi:hypothetical protein